MDHLVEAASAQDTDALLALERSVFVVSDGKLSRRAFTYHTRTTNLLLVTRPAPNSPEISGYILVFVRKYSARIYSLATAQAYRHQGVASALLSACFNVLASRGISHVTLELRESNQQAKALYASLGFTIGRIQPNYYGDGETAICMRRAVLASSDATASSTSKLLLVNSTANHNDKCR